MYPAKLHSKTLQQDDIWLMPKGRVCQICSDFKSNSFPLLDPTACRKPCDRWHEFSVFMHMLLVSFQLLIIFCIGFKRGYCSFKEIPRLLFVTAAEGGTVEKEGTERNKIKKEAKKKKFKKCEWQVFKQLALAWTESCEVVCPKNGNKWAGFSCLVDSEWMSIF